MYRIGNHYQPNQTGKTKRKVNPSRATPLKRFVVCLRESHDKNKPGRGHHYDAGVLDAYG